MLHASAEQENERCGAITNSRRQDINCADDTIVSSFWQDAARKIPRRACVMAQSAQNVARSPSM
jgi:hypothetical protein